MLTAQQDSIEEQRKKNEQQIDPNQGTGSNPSAPAINKGTYSSYLLPPKPSGYTDDEINQHLLAKVQSLYLNATERLDPNGAITVTDPANLTDSFGVQILRLDNHAHNNEAISDLKHAAYYAVVRSDFISKSIAEYQSANANRTLSGKVYAGMYNKHTLEDKGEFDEGVIYITFYRFKADASLALLKNGSDPISEHFEGTYSTGDTDLALTRSGGTGTIKGSAYKDNQQGTINGILGTIYLEKGEHIISGIYSTDTASTLSAFSSSIVSVSSQYSSIAEAIANEIKQKYNPTAQIQNIFATSSLAADPHNIADFRVYRYRVLNHNPSGAIFHSTYHAYVDLNSFSTVEKDRLMSFDLDRTFKGSVVAYGYKHATLEVYQQYGDQSNIKIVLKKSAPADIDLRLFNSINVSDGSYVFSAPLALNADNRGFTVTDPTGEATIGGKFVEKNSGYPQLGIVGTIDVSKGDTRIVGVYSSALQLGQNVHKGVYGGYVLALNDNPEAVLGRQVKSRHSMTYIQPAPSSNYGSISNQGDPIEIGWRSYTGVGYVYEGVPAVEAGNHLPYKAYFIRLDTSLSLVEPSTLTGDKTFAGPLYGGLYDRVTLGNSGEIDSAQSNISLTIARSGSVNADLNIYSIGSNAAKSATLSGPFLTEVGKEHTFNIVQNGNTLNGAMYNQGVIGEFKVGVDNAIAEGVYSAKPQ